MAASAMVSSAYAQQVLSDVISSPRRGNWDDQFDARATGGRRVATNQPVLSPQTVADIQNAIVQYTDIASRGGWPLGAGQCKAPDWR